MHRISVLLLAVAIMVTACAPGTNVHVEVPRSLSGIESATGSPPRQAVYSALKAADLFAELERVAKVVHPQYSVSRTAISFDRKPLAHTYITTLTSGVTRYAMDPRDHESARRLAPLLEAWDKAGLTQPSSGLPEFEPVEIPSALVMTGGELYRFYVGTSRDDLLNASRVCRSDYLVSEAGRNPDFGVDGTDMPDGRTRLYVNVFSVRYLGLSQRAELRRELGLLLACLDARLGPGRDA